MVVLGLISRGPPHSLIWEHINYKQMEARHFSSLHRLHIFVLIYLAFVRSMARGSPAEESSLPFYDDLSHARRGENAIWLSENTIISIS